MKIKVTPELVKAVQDDKCQGCGKQSYEDCPRPGDKDCFREFHGGKRKRVRD